MTTVTVDDYQRNIADEVGDPNNTVMFFILTAWDIYADKPLELQRLYVKRAAINKRLVEEQGSYDYNLGRDLAESLSQKFTHLQQMRDDTHAEILRIETQAQGMRVPKYGALTTVAPTTPPCPDGPDRNDTRLTGDPYWANP